MKLVKLRKHPDLYWDCAELPHEITPSRILFDVNKLYIGVGTWQALTAIKRILDRETYLF